MTYSPLVYLDAARAVANLSESEIALAKRLASEYRGPFVMLLYQLGFITIEQLDAIWQRVLDHEIEFEPPPS